MELNSAFWLFLVYKAEMGSMRNTKMKSLRTGLSLFAVSLLETVVSAVKTDETQAVTPTRLGWLPDDSERALANWYDSSTRLQRPLNFISWFFFTCTSRNYPKLTRPRNP